MRAALGPIVATAGLILISSAHATEWIRYSPPSAGVSVDFPADIFTVDAGPVAGNAGHAFRTSDGRADFSIYTKTNKPRVSPHDFLRRNFELAPESIVYSRVTERILVVSGYRDNKIWYARCNFASNINCIQLNYPTREKLLWDAIVTRISNSLASKTF